jgi:hypothetical protein
MAKKNKLPKRIAGVKIPKKLRKRGGQVFAFLDSPVISSIVAAGLLAAADSISRQPKVRKAGKKAGKMTKHASADTSEAAESNVIDFASILAMAAREGARALKNR